MDFAVTSLILFALGIWIALKTMQAAKRRGRSVTAWMWLAILFGPFAWLAVAMLPSVRKEDDGLTPNGSNGESPARPTGSVPAAGKVTTGRSNSLLLRPASA